MIPDLLTSRRELRAGQSTALDKLELSIAAAESPRCQHVFSQPTFDLARAQAAASRADQPLAGLSVSVKDLFDVAGQRTRAGSTVLDDRPLALSDSTAVARLRAAGGAIIGRTHMVEFAFSGVGVNPHFGTPAAWDGRAEHPAGSDGAGRVPGGSSSGAAVSVATGAAYIGLGSDTGGSIRIPAALNGIVGFKSTARRVPTDGAVPLSTTLDTVCAVTRSVGDAIVAHEILAARSVTRSSSPISSYRLAVPATVMLDNLDIHVARAFERAVRQLRDAGAHVEEIPLETFRDLAGLQASGGFSAAESYAWHRKLLDRRTAEYDPRVRTRIERGAAMTAHEYIELVHARQHWIERVERALSGFDAFLSPTVPIVAPPIASVAPADGRDLAADAARDAEFFRVNSLLLRNTSVVNMLDGCAVSIPCHVTGELPVGLMIWQGAMRDDTVLALALEAERLLENK
jgi:amidase/aspartyl-tRNA(Asn)/glutamyl-tRNA(Gln) amidotransferase subunit A